MEEDAASELVYEGEKLPPIKAFDTLEMFKENGALAGTVVRGFGERWEQPLSDIFTDMQEPGLKPSVREQLKKQPEAKTVRHKKENQQER